MFASTVLIIGLVSLLLPSQFVRGLVIGTGITGVGSAIWIWAIQSTGTAPTMMGDLGEQLTAGELRKLRRHGWRIVNHVTLRPARDVDHVLVGPGGLFAVETKWSATPWSQEPIDGRIVDAAAQARENAHDLTIWHHLRSLGVGEVKSVVIVWGAGARDFTAALSVSGTTVLAGPKLARWRRGLTEAELTSSQVEAAWQALDAQCRVRDPREQAAQPLPRSAAAWCAWMAAVVFSGAFGVVATSKWIAWHHDLAITSLGCAALFVLGLGLMRIRPARSLALAWTTAVGAVSAILALLVILRAR
jgi:hypothetical protein